MRHINSILAWALFCLCLPIALQAQNEDMSKYLEGAVPVVNGKVTYTKEYSIPQMSEEEIYRRMSQWMEQRLAANKNNSRVLLRDKEQGQLVGTGDEWMVFTSNAFSLDRSRILYQLFVQCAPEKCTLEISKISFVYREGEERYTAEEWITDKYALNKSKTKLVRGLAKWRIHTVNLMDKLCVEAADALSAVNADQTLAEQKKEETKKPEPVKSVATSGTQVIVPKNQVTASEPARTAPTVPSTPVQPAAQAATGYSEVTPESLTDGSIQTTNGQWVIVIGEEPFNMTTMTANAGGSLGKVKGEPVVFTILTAEQNYAPVEQAKQYTVRFYPTGEKSPSLILQCQPIPAPAAMEGMPRTYIGKILKAEKRD